MPEAPRAVLNICDTGETHAQDKPRRVNMQARAASPQHAQALYLKAAISPHSTPRPPTGVTALQQCEHWSLLPFSTAL